jgi:hypothetical protein
MYVQNTAHVSVDDGCLYDVGGGSVTLHQQVPYTK